MSLRRRTPSILLEFFGMTPYTKTRRFGGWSNRRRERYLERCAILLEATSVPLSPGAKEFDPPFFLKPESDESDESDGCEDGTKCPVCGGAMRLIDRREKPSWREIMSSPRRPSWYGHDSL